jgi:hypothetical protein
MIGIEAPGARTQIGKKVERMTKSEHLVRASKTG